MKLLAKIIQLLFPSRALGSTTINLLFKDSSGPSRLKFFRYLIPFPNVELKEQILEFSPVFENLILIL
ncbi:hypothetical protein DSECCO2_451570 [anaerobic digester metagenome]